MFSLLALGSVLLQAIAVYASPLRVDSSVSLSRREISSELLGNFNLFSQFAALSACDQNINSTGHRLTCDLGACGLVDADDTDIVDVFHSATGATGYIALDHTKKLIVLSFRTSVSENDLSVDNENAPTAINQVCPGCWAHSGFWKYWTSVSEQVISQLRRTSMAHPDHSIAIVGHSLGGALATIAGTVLRQQGFKLDIWSFGSPKVGNHRLATYISHATPSVYRATHYSDSVPQQPSVPSLDYSQISPEYWISVPLQQEVTTKDVQYFNQADSKKGNAGHASTFSPDAPDLNHMQYFGPMQVCALPSDMASMG